ncbi:heme ABC transporter permease [Thalassospira alkalitolerans]|uniref:heme ABC transporter permease n=1 Tax=Thalassospira alkalitolerans TaxID=1293890 RepID=UPI003AA87F42
MHRFAKPSVFLKLTGAMMPWMVTLTVILTAVGLYLALFASPVDYQQGSTVRIMYIHVPAAWMGLFCYIGMAACGAMSLIWKHPLADICARATAPIGATFTALTLITGSLWGEPMWGTWWVWDARLTSMLILLFLYLGYIALVNAFDDPERGSKAGSALALVGAINVPIVKFSVDWWNTLHQPASVARMDGPSIDPSMLAPLLIMAFAFTGYYFIVLVLRVRLELNQRRIRALQLSGVFDDRAPTPGDDSNLAYDQGHNAGAGK